MTDITPDAQRRYSVEFTITRQDVFDLTDLPRENIQLDWWAELAASPLIHTDNVRDVRLRRLPRWVAIEENDGAGASIVAEADSPAEALIKYAEFAGEREDTPPDEILGELVGHKDPQVELRWSSDCWALHILQLPWAPGRA